MVAPLANGSNGRDGSGRFAKGNPGGPGNPLARRTAAVRRLFNESVGEDDLRAVVAELVARAKAGEPWAVRELLDRMLGKAERIPEASGEDQSGPALARQNEVEAAMPFVRELIGFIESLPTESVPARMREWLDFYKMMNSEDGGANWGPNIRLYAFKGFDEAQRTGLLEASRDADPYEVPIESD